MLDTLLGSFFSREERATALPEAFTPPGLEASAPPLPPPATRGAQTPLSGSSLHGRPYGSGTGSGKGTPSTSPSNERICTTPAELLAEIALRKAAAPSAGLSQQMPQLSARLRGEGGPASGTSTDNGVAGSERTSSSYADRPDGPMPELPNPAESAAVLPSGEVYLQVLDEIEEDVREFDEHVFRHRSPLEQRFGPSGPW